MVDYATTDVHSSEQTRKRTRSLGTKPTRVETTTRFLSTFLLLSFITFIGKITCSVQSLQVGAVIVKKWPKSPWRNPTLLYDGKQKQAEEEDPERVFRESWGLDPRRSEELLEYSIDSFLRGDYDRPYDDDAPAPLPGLSPGATVEAALRSLRQLDDPEPSHGAAVLMRFCAPLSRGERWGGSPSSGKDVWKEILRGALTPTMLARRIRASNEFSGLLDWRKLDVTDGTTGKKDLVGLPTVAFVNAALYFEEGMEPDLIQFQLRRYGGVWLIYSAKRIEMDKLFTKRDYEED